MSIVKQILINNLNISSDNLLDKIKSYCFYDVKTWETISFIKSKKERIHYLFNNETFSRANPFHNHGIEIENDYDDDDWHHYNYNHDIEIQNGYDDDEHWYFRVNNEDDGPNRQFQAINCRVCGNYVSIDPIVPNNIKCFCHNDNDWTDDGEEWEEDWEDWLTDGTDN